MPEPIHGHEVLQMMLSSGQAYTRATLRADILARFGSEARFFTCSAENLTADGLISFFEERGKFVPASGGFQADRGKICKD